MLEHPAGPDLNPDTLEGHRIMAKKNRTTSKARRATVAKHSAVKGKKALTRSVGAGGRPERASKPPIEGTTMPDTFMQPDRISDTTFTRAQISNARTDAGPSLQVLWREFRASWKTYSKAMDEIDKVRTRARPHRPPRPASLTRDFLLADGGHKSFELNQDFIKSMTHIGALTADEGTQLLAECKNWDAACRAIDEAHGMLAAETAETAAADRYEEAQQRFIKAPTRSVEDIGLKLRFLADLENYSQERDIAPAMVVYAMLRDIKAGKVT